MHMVIKIIFYLKSKYRHWYVTFSHWFWVQHYKGKLILKTFKISDTPLSFLIEDSGSIQINQGVNFAGTSKLLAFEDGKITIGKNTFFNRNCSINSLQEIRIGDNCLFGEDVKIYDHNHGFTNNNKIIREQGYKKAAITIGNNVWVGSGTIILKGVNIGDNAVIGAGCILKDDVASNTICTINVVTKKNKIKFK